MKKMRRYGDSSSVLVPSSDALWPLVASLLLVVRPGAPSVMETLEKCSIFWGETGWGLCFG